VTGYTVYRGGAVLATTNTTSYTDSTVSPSTAYSYTVDAFDAAGNHSPQSTALPITTPATPPPTAHWVQGGAIATGSRVSTVTITLPAAVTAGDLLVGWFGQYDSTGQVQVSDNVNGAWTRSAAATTFSSGGGDIALFYVQNAKAAPTGLTVTIAAAVATYLQGSAAEYANMATTNSLDKFSVASGSGTTADSGATASVSAGEILISGFMTGTGPGTVTAGGGMTLHDHTGSYSVDDADVFVTATGAQHAVWTLKTSADWYVVGAVFHTAAGP
jgi:chitodextrinase